jgi:beta-galactosidase
LQKATFVRTTPGAAAAIRLRAEANTLKADLNDARLVFIDIVDSNGTIVPTDGSVVTLTISGSGSIVGPEVLTMKGGQLATWVRAGRKPGAITLTASAPGLKPFSLTLTSLAVPGLPPAPADRKQ